MTHSEIVAEYEFYLYLGLTCIMNKHSNAGSQRAVVLTAGVKQSVGLSRTWMAYSESVCSM